MNVYEVYLENATVTVKATMVDYDNDELKFYRESVLIGIFREWQGFLFIRKENHE